MAVHPFTTHEFVVNEVGECVSGDHVRQLATRRAVAHSLERPPMLVGSPHPQRESVGPILLSLREIAD
jgi:hypothetical protein